MAPNVLHLLVFMPLCTLCPRVWAGPSNLLLFYGTSYGMSFPRITYKKTVASILWERPTWQGQMPRRNWVRPPQSTSLHQYWTNHPQLNQNNSYMNELRSRFSSGMNSEAAALTNFSTAPVEKPWAWYTPTHALLPVHKTMNIFSPY